MEGWKLAKGELVSRELTVSEIRYYFNILFSTKSKKQTSYKYVIIKALLENLYNTDSNLFLNYSIVFNSFTRIYWNFIMKYGLKQSDNSHNQSGIERVLLTIKDHHEISNELSFEGLPLDLKLKIQGDIKRVGKRYVVGAIYGDTEGRFYGFDNKKEYFLFNSSVLTFMKSCE